MAGGVSYDQMAAWHRNLLAPEGLVKNEANCELVEQALSFRPTTAFLAWTERKS